MKAEIKLWLLEVTVSGYLYLICSLYGLHVLLLELKNEKFVERVVPNYSEKRPRWMKRTSGANKGIAYCCWVWLIFCELTLIRGPRHIWLWPMLQFRSKLDDESEKPTHWRRIWGTAWIFGLWLTSFPFADGNIFLHICSCVMTVLAVIAIFVFPHTNFKFFLLGLNIHECLHLMKSNFPIEKLSAEVKAGLKRSALADSFSWPSSTHLLSATWEHKFHHSEDLSPKEGTYCITLLLASPFLLLSSWLTFPPWNFLISN